MYKIAVSYTLSLLITAKLLHQSMIFHITEM
jgi:hypothetical protein